MSLLAPSISAKKTGGGSWKGWGAAPAAPAAPADAPADAPAAVPATTVVINTAATASAAGKEEEKVVAAFLPGWVYIRRNPAAPAKPLYKYGPPVINAYLDDCWAREVNSQAIFKQRQWRENRLIQYYNESLGDLSPYWYLHGKQRRWIEGGADVAAANPVEGVVFGE